MNNLATKGLNIVELLVASILLPYPCQEISVCDSRRKNDLADLELKDSTRALIYSSSDEICED